MNDSLERVNLLMPAGEAALAWLEHTRELLALTDHAGQITWANTHFCRLTGLHAKSGHHIDALPQAGQSGDAGRRALALARHGNAVADAEFECRTLQGDRLCVRARAAPREGGQIAWVMQDITELTVANERAARQTELLQMAQEFGRMGIWERDLASGSGQWDPHIFRFWGWDPSMPTPDIETLMARIHPADQATVRNYLESTRQPGTYAQRYRVLHADGGVRHIHAQWRVKAGPSNQPESVVGVLMDDTEAFVLARSLGDATEQLELAVAMANIAIWRHDLKTNLMHYSDRAFKVLDIPPRPDGMPIAEVRALIHPEDLPRVLASAQQTLQTGQATDVEARYLRSNGTWRNIMTRRVLQRSPSGEPVAFLGVGLDVTEQVATHLHAIELTRRLNAAAQAARVGLWALTPALNQADWNDQMFELLDLDKSPQAPPLRQWVDACIHADDRECVWQQSLDYMRGGDAPVEIEFRTIRRDGSTRWMVLRADVDRGDTEHRRLWGVMLDVTEHREALAALRHADQRAALAARSAGIGTWEVDAVTGTETWDAQMFALRNLPVGERPPSREQRLAMVHPADQHLVLDSRSDSMSADEPLQYEFRVLLANGNTRWLASRSIPVRNAQGVTVSQVGVNWDITESKYAQSVLQDKVLAERESQAKSQFLSRMSHELRTPMNAVLGFTQLLQRHADAALGPEQQRQLGHIRTAGEHLLSLIDDVLDLSRLEGGSVKLELQAVDLGATVDHAVALLESTAAQAQVRLRYTHSAGAAGAWAWADPTRVLQIVLNLLTNGIKFNRQGGQVTIQTRQDGDVCTLSVTDTGHGMTSEQSAHLFEPFNRLGVDADAVPGTGIGLVIVKALAERMGGSIGVVSQAGRGTTFDLTLPCAATGANEAGKPLTAERAPASCALRAAAGVESRPRGRILYIEDNPVNVMLVEELVAMIPGLSVVAEGTGQAGVQRGRNERPDLILVDMQLPDFDGYEVLRRLRSQPETAATPCIALSANAMQEDIARAMSAGFDDYWTKPINFPVFIAALESRFPLQSAGVNEGLSAP